MRLYYLLKRKAKNAKKRQSGYMPRYIFYFINILFSICLQAQSSGDLFDANQAILSLKSGHLLVRLEARENKINFLQKELNHTSCNEKCKEKIQSQLNNLLSDRDTFNKQLIRSFKLYFKFCPVFFYYDKDHQALLDSDWKGPYFLDGNLSALALPSIQTDSFLILKKDITPNSENEGWLFQTAQGKTFRNNFPYISENNFTTMMNRISYSNHIKQNCNYMVKKLNKKLFSYLHQVVEKQMDARRTFEEE